MNIDKRALREVAEKATKGEWWSDVVETDGEYGEGEDRVSGYHSYAVYVGHESLLDMINSTAACIHTEWDHDYHMAWDETAKRNAEFIAAANPATVLALLDENIQLQREKDAMEAVALALRDDMRQSREKLEAAERSIAELERSETQLINERDAAESALADMYQAATGERPEWSNMFGFADAVDVVEERLATLEANQSQTTPTGIQLITEAIGAHGYIVGCLLQGRPDLALEESRKWVSAFGQAAEIVSAQDADDIKVKGE
ncbi:ead/Ea22-like family protein [Salmonella enterica]|nr:ead/Ea22-like family protein [Salmonella enterica]ECC3215670.1 ead/Ea22-like family protein [Salmonella enterica subsp. enterica]